MATEWEFYMRCPKGHGFVIKSDEVVLIPKDCPTCNLPSRKSGLEQWLTLRRFRKQLRSFQIEDSKD